MRVKSGRDLLMRSLNKESSINVLELGAFFLIFLFVNLSELTVTSHLNVGVSNKCFPSKIVLIRYHKLNLVYCYMNINSFDLTECLI